MKKMNRRNFIKTTPLWPVGIATGTAALSALGQTAPAGRAAPEDLSRKSPEAPPLKVSLNAYCFSKALTPPASGGKPEMTYFDVLDFCARHNFDGIDPTAYYFPGYPKVPSDSFIYDFKRRAFKLGLAITGTGVRNNFASPDKDSRAADVQLVKDWIEVAAKLGAPVIRVFAGAEPQGHSREEVVEWMVPDLRKCVEYGRQHGVVVGIQNHGDFLKTADQVLTIVKKLNSEWFGVIVDTGNFQSSDPYEEIARVAPFAVNFQVKESPLGRGSPVRTDLKKLVRAVRAGGYRGYLPIETLSQPGDDPRVNVPRLLKELREAIASA